MKNYVYFVTQEETGRSVICENIEKVKEVITKDYSEKFINELSHYKNFTETELKQRVDNFFTEKQKISNYEDSILNKVDYCFGGYYILKTEFDTFFE